MSVRANVNQVLRTEPCIAPYSGMQSRVRDQKRRQGEQRHTQCIIIIISSSSGGGDAVQRAERRLSHLLATRGDRDGKCAAKATRAIRHRRKLRRIDARCPVLWYIARLLMPTDDGDGAPRVM